MVTQHGTPSIPLTLLFWNPQEHLDNFSKKMFGMKTLDKRLICYFTYAFQSQSILYSSLYVKGLLARSRRKIWCLSDCNWTRTQNHLVRKGTLNHLPKLVECSFCQMHRTDKYSEHSSIISKNWPVWPNDWLFVYELSGSGFESSCS